MAHSETFFNTALVIGIALLPIIAVDMPRFYALGPGIIGLVFLALYTPAFKEKPVFDRATWLVPVVITGLALISTLWAISPETSLDRVQKLLLVLLPGGLFLTLAKNIKPGQLQKHLWLIPAGVVTAALLIAFELLTGGIFHKFLRDLPPDAQIPEASFNRGTVAATLCAFPSFFILRSYMKPLSAAIVLGVPLAIMMVFSQSQSSQLALFLGVLVYFVFPYNRKKAWMGAIALVTAAIFAAPFLAIWMYENFAPALNSMPFFGASDGYAGARLEIWNFVSHHILTHPWIGSGIEATKIIEAFQSEEMYFSSHKVLHPHNFALQFWIEFGALGAAVASTLCGYIMWMMYKHLTTEQRRIALPTFIASMSVAATGYGFWQSWWLGLLFVLTGLCMIAAKAKNDS